MFQQYFTYIMTTLFSGRGNRREPPTMVTHLYYLILFFRFWLGLGVRVRVRVRVSVRVRVRAWVRVRVRVRVMVSITTWLCNCLFTVSL